MRKTTITSDITGRNITDEDIVHVHEEFWFGSPYDCGILSVDTTKEELEELFKKKIARDNTRSGCCYVCDASIAQMLLDDCVVKHISIDEYIAWLKEQSFSVRFWNQTGEYRIDICMECVGKYFEKYIVYGE